MPKRQHRFLIALAVAAVVGPGLWQMAQLAIEQHAMVAKLDHMHTYHHALAREHERLTTDPIFVEGLIRSTFRVAKPNEFVVRLDRDGVRSSH